MNREEVRAEYKIAASQLAKLQEDYNKLGNQSIEVIHDLSARNTVLESAMRESLTLMNDSRNLGIIQCKFKKLLEIK